MIAAAELIREAEAAGAIVTMDGEQLKLVHGKLLPAPLVEKMKLNKPGILEVMKRDLEAKAAGFLTLLSGEVYQRQISYNSLVFIALNDSGKWYAWRESWSRQEQATACKSVSSKDIVNGLIFDHVMFKAKQYIERLNSHTGSVRQ